MPVVNIILECEVERRLGVLLLSSKRKNKDFVFCYKQVGMYVDDMKCPSHNSFLNKHPYGKLSPPFSHSSLRDRVDTCIG